MGRTISYERPDGQSVVGYLAEPLKGANAPGMVLIQEWWGLNDQIKGVADKLAATGYRALVPDLYRGKVALEANEAEHLMTNLNFGDAAGQDVRGAVRYLKASGSVKVGVTGFCMGGALTLLAAVNVPEADAGVAWYGACGRGLLGVCLRALHAQCAQRHAVELWQARIRCAALRRRTSSRCGRGTRPWASGTSTRRITSSPGSPSRAASTRRATTTCGSTLRRSCRSGRESGSGSPGLSSGTNIWPAAVANDIMISICSTREGRPWPSSSFVTWKKT